MASRSLWGGAASRALRHQSSAVRRRRRLPACKCPRRRIAGFSSSSSYSSTSPFPHNELPFKGAVIDLAEHPDESARAFEDGGESFVSRLTHTIDTLRAAGANSVWLDVPAVDAVLAGHAAKHLGFDFHHAEGPRCVLKKWINTEMEDKIPTPLATHQVGCAGLVTNDDRKELLVIKEAERHNGVRVQWKLPGGMLDRGEDIEDAVTREVWEETGIHTTFNSVLSFWNRHYLAPWGQSDIYVVAHLSPVDAMQPINMDPAELSACRWMGMEEFVSTENHPLILELLDHYYGLYKADDGSAAWRNNPVVSSPPPPQPQPKGLQRVDIQWPKRPVCPTYLSKKS